MSDTHGNSALARKALSLSEPVDAVLHLGDGSADAERLRETPGVPVVNVAGNCDVGGEAPRELLWECAGKKILLTHGDAYGVKSGLDRLEARASEVGADAVLFGHSHRATHIVHPGLLILNPGTLSREARHHSYAVVHVTSDGITARLIDLD